MRSSELRQRYLPDCGDNPWLHVCSDILSAWETETVNDPLPPDECLSFAYDFLAQLRREEFVGRGIPLMTIHAAKGMEFNHILICSNFPNGCQSAEREEERRLLYVGMTRAQQTLSIFMRSDLAHPLGNELTGRPFYRHSVKAVQGSVNYRPKTYEVLGLSELYIGYAGLFPPGNSIHKDLEALNYGDRLKINIADGWVELLTPKGNRVAQLSTQASDFWRDRLESILEIRITALVVRRKSDTEDPDFLAKTRCDKWLIPLCEITSYTD